MKKLMISMGFVLLLMSTSGQNGLQVGNKAPLFSIKSDDGSVWNLADHMGEKNIVLYFYPAAMTGGCTKQACSYRDHQEDMGKVNAMVVGISGDDVAALQVFKKAHNLNFPLLSDFDGAVAQSYGVPTGAGGSLTRNVDNADVILNRGVTTQRWTFIIGTDGLIKYVNQKVDAENDFKSVLEVLGQK
ncbi:MAG TPA: peroxiredoxin [Prolixibacteraceae bacterium]|nr:peroxiredoxin [Prolixibacteraceae bacterium]